MVQNNLADIVKRRVERSILPGGSINPLAEKVQSIGDTADGPSAVKVRLHQQKIPG
jgi:hypothetical protein